MVVSTVVSNFPRGGPVSRYVVSGVLDWDCKAQHFVTLLGQRKSFIRLNMLLGIITGPCNIKLCQCRQRFMKYQLKSILKLSNFFLQYHNVMTYQPTGTLDFGLTSLVSALNPRILVWGLGPRACQ